VAGAWGEPLRTGLANPLADGRYECLEIRQVVGEHTSVSAQQVEQLTMGARFA
jgi:hypothetical protein